LAVRIRLTRIGATKRPSYRVVAIDSRRPRDGRALEILGFYDPLTDPATVQIDSDRIAAWIGKGAQPSETVVKLMKQAKSGATAAAEPAAPAKPAPRKRAAAKPKAAAESQASA
jgi:small subunit ribosomal protein S16